MKHIETKTDPSGTVLYRLLIRKRSSINSRVRAQVRSEWFDTEAEALKQEKKLNKKIDEQLARRQQEGCSWGSLVERWELALRTGKDIGRKITASTVENYCHGLRTHTKKWWNAPANQINSADVRDLYLRLNQEGHSRSMEQKMRSALNGIFAWGIENRLLDGIDRSPAQGVSLVGRNEEKKPEILTIGEIRKLLKFSEEYKHEWHSIWAVALFTGARNGELHELRWTDVDFENKLISIHRAYNTKTRSVGPTKSSYWRHVPISEELEGLLKELKLSGGGREHVLPRFKEWDKGYQARILRAFCEGIGIPSIKFHTLRACFGTQLIRDGIAPGTVMSICGWKDLETMQIYIRRAGIDVKGATDGLKLLTHRETMGRVVELFRAT